MACSLHGERIDSLDEVWARWAEVGAELSEQQWSSPTRCTGWDVAAVYAHVGMFPSAVLAPPAGEVEQADPVTAVDILRGFNAPGGVAHTVAEQVARAARAGAADLDRADLVARYAEQGPRAVAALRHREARSLLPWPSANAVTTWAEAVRIVLAESVVHLLDVLDGLGREPDVPAPALREAVHLLAEVAPPVSFVEAATGRSERSPLPVLR